ncbi:MAG: N-acetyltransferase [Clostridia bacterium]|nr:N-acetyltransferase [Clostridia bacterium]
MIIVKEVATKRDMKKFVSFPVEMYKDCPYYVPAMYGDEITILDEKKNYNLKDAVCKCFLAYKDGKLAGRIAGIYSEVENKTAEKKLVRFSRIDAIDDFEVFKALIEAVEEFGREKGAELIHGPWGFNDTDREGMLTFGFEEMATYATNYSYPYYVEHMEKLGFLAESKWVEKKFGIPTEVDERIRNLAPRIEKRLKVVDLARTMKVGAILDKYADEFFETYNESYGVLDGFVKFEGKAKDQLLDSIKMAINERYLSFLVDEEGKVAAFGVMLPSMAKALKKTDGKLFPFGFITLLKAINKPKELEMALIGVKEKYKNSGITSIIITNIISNIIEDKIERVESNPMLETNYLIQQQWKFLDAEIIKKRQTYIKEIAKA